MMKYILKILLAFMIFICVFFTFYNVNADSINWNSIDYVQPYEGKNIYKEKTGNEILESAILGNKRKTENKIYEVVDVDNNRIKIKITSGWNQEGWINKSSVKFYPGKEVKFQSFSTNGGSESAIWRTGTIVGAGSGLSSWQIKDENGEWTIPLSSLYEVDDEDPDTGLDNDKVNENTNQKEEEKEAIINSGNCEDMSDEELIALYQDIIAYENKFGNNDKSVEDKKKEVEDELVKRGYDIDDLLGIETGIDRGDTIYTSQPKKEDNKTAGDSLDDVMNDAENFISTGTTKYENESNLQELSNIIYNILLTVGVAVAVIVGAIIGVKLMASNIETKVEAKRLLIPYVVGCFVVFGAFGIWKIVVNILQQL